MTGVQTCALPIFAREISEHFGKGRITGSDGKTGEPALFNQPNAWIDYSGTVPGHEEGITLIDHPGNIGHPPRWHVRADGWMGPSLTRTGDLTIRRESPLTSRYLLAIHAGTANLAIVAEATKTFSQSRPWSVLRSTRPHRQFEARR